MNRAVILLVGLLATAGHPLHISVTEIEMKPDKKELHVVMHVFIDDLETAIRSSRHNPNLDIARPPAGLTTDDLVREYLREKFTMATDDTNLPWKYLGSEAEGDALYFYILAENVNPWKTIEVRNTVLIETYEDQSNIINVEVADQVRSMRLTRGKPYGHLSFG